VIGAGATAYEASPGWKKGLIDNLSAREFTHLPSPSINPSLSEYLGASPGRRELNWKKPQATPLHPSSPAVAPRAQMQGSAGLPVPDDRTRTEAAVRTP
jgi:hypothetical protein